MGSHIFSSQSLKISQYLVNGVSDQKGARNKRDVEFNFLYFVKTRFNVSSTIIVLFQFQKKVPKIKKGQNLENGEFYEKSAYNKKCKILFYTRHVLQNFLYLQSYNFYYRNRFSKNPTLSGLERGFP